MARYSLGRLVDGVICTASFVRLHRRRLARHGSTDGMELCRSRRTAYYRQKEVARAQRGDEELAQTADAGVRRNCRNVGGDVGSHYSSRSRNNDCTGSGYDDEPGGDNDVTGSRGHHDLGPGANILRRRPDYDHFASRTDDDHSPASHDHFTKCAATNDHDGGAAANDHDPR